MPGVTNEALISPDQTKALALGDTASFNFLAVFEGSDREGWGPLLQSYFEEFKPDEDVCLYVRTRLSGNLEIDARAQIEDRFQSFLRNNNFTTDSIPRVLLVTASLPLEDEPKVYKSTAIQETRKNQAALR